MSKQNVADIVTLHIPQRPVAREYVRSGHLSGKKGVIQVSQTISASFKLSLILSLLGALVAATPLNTVATDSARTSAIDGISITPDNQILVELMPEDTTPANLFDLNGRTLIFTPDGQGGYSRKVQALAWEENIGEPVADGAVVALERFTFAFAGQRWDSFHVSRHGLLTFGGPFTYSYTDIENRFATMREIADGFVATPTISPLYKPMFGGMWFPDPLASQHVAHWPDRIVVTWFVTDPQFYIRGIPPEHPDRFQTVLYADGSIRFSYADVTVGDGIVGLFPNDAVVKGDIIASITDGVDRELPGHLDLLEAAIYATNTDAVILEFVTRGPIPEPSGDTVYSYRLHFDTDRPWWTHLDFSDEDFAAWQIDVKASGEYTARGRGVEGVWASDTGSRIALLADIGDLQGVSVSVIAGAFQFDDDSFVQGGSSDPAEIKLPVIPETLADLSQSDAGFSQKHSEVFHYRSVPDLGDLACRVVDVLDDRFDLFVFHNEFRVDSQERGSPWRPYDNGRRPKGLALPFQRSVPCGEGRLLGHYNRPVWMQSFHFDGELFDSELEGFAHEFMHTWTAHLSYEKDGTREPLFDANCRCHWRFDLHIPAAFPWRGRDAGSLMADWKAEGGGFWRDNRDGTFTLINRYAGWGPSWLDLYAMGLADASEVPDMFILRNLKRVGEGLYTGEKEIISIEQIIAAEGPREPSAAESQKVFNAGFVYLLEPGQTSSPDLIALHAEYLNAVKEYWSHITGGRSHITTHVDVPRPATLENPAPSSFQSGLGVISGWACEAEEIVIELAGTPVQAAYGTPRSDTHQVCGDTNNGFGLLVNWNNLGNGEHTIRALADGVEFATTTVRVTTFGVEVLRGVSGTFTLSDFPAVGETTAVQWQEAKQNFVITAGQPGTGGGYSRVAGVPAVLEIPPLGSSQSGLGLISGWACEAEEIVIELAGTPIPAAYGTPRADTQMRCGDTNNGFGLLVNWNNLGDGEYPIRALADGVEFANTTVQVTTFGVEFLRGVSGTFTLSDFPRSGNETRIRWEESLQNFVIVP